MNSDKVCLLVRVEGIVQGVGYRAWVARTAKGLGLKGWVRNRQDGSVEALIQGDKATIDGMLERCRTGPRMAVVSSVETSQAEVEPLNDFSIRPTE